MVHTRQQETLWKKHTVLSKVKVSPPQPGILSPNNSYFFLVEARRPHGTVTIYAEKTHLRRITFTALFGLSDVKWINEKLLFMRPWWGRAQATDLIYDVEQETFLYAETVMDRLNAHQQFLESCPQFECQCIKKSTGRAGKADEE